LNYQSHLGFNHPIFVILIVLSLALFPHESELITF
jgi:hypothetical protein